MELYTLRIGCYARGFSIIRGRIMLWLIYRCLLLQSDSSVKEFDLLYLDVCCLLRYGFYYDSA